MSSKTTSYDDQEKVHRTLFFHEFVEFVDDGNNRQSLEPIPSLFSNAVVKNNPLFWVRLVSLASLCNALIRREGDKIACKAAELDLPLLLAATEDNYIIDNKERFLSAIEPFEQFQFN